jgi:hypothetical protein
MIRIEVSLNNSRLEELLFLIRKLEGGLPNTEEAMAAGAAKIQSAWQNYALGKKRLPGVAALKKPSGKYAESIRTEQTGAFKHEIFSEAEIADRIENGAEELDMKKTHPFGPRSRVSNKGIPYLIIPFRWGTPGDKKNQRVGFGNNVMTAGAYYQISKKPFGASRVTASADQSDYKTPNAKGDMVGRAQYRDKNGKSTWGSRLRGSDFSGTVEQKTRMDGMVRFENGFDKNGKIGKRYGGYLTFRVISAKSPAGSWIKPAEPAYHVTRGVKEYTEDEVALTAREGLEKDFRL